MTTEVPKHANLIEALAAAQGEFEPLTKEKPVDAGARKYKYADLADVLAVVRPVLARHQIAILQHTQPLDGGALMLHTELRGWGEVLTSSMPLAVSLASPQAFGSYLTYARRYSLMTLCGVAAEADDDDGQAAGHKPPPTGRDQSETGREAAPRQSRPDLLNERPRTPPDDAWLEAARLKVENAEPDALRAWWNSPDQRKQRLSLHQRRRDFEEPMEALRVRVAERWWECSNLEIPPGDMGWQKWQGLIARTVDAAPTSAALNQLLADNTAHLDALRQAAPKAGEALDAKISNALFTLDGEAPVLGGDEEGGP